MGFGRLVLAIAASAALVLSAPFLGEFRRQLQRTFPAQFVVIVGASVAAAVVVAILIAIARMRTHRGPLPPEFVTLRFKPEPWTVRNTLSIAKIMAWDLADYDLAANALEGSVFRMLRQGQRVVFDVDGSGRATTLRLGSEVDMSTPAVAPWANG